MNPLRRYVRVRLHRRIFVWFGVSIGLTIAILSGVMALLAQPSPWRRDIVRAERFLGYQFADVWQRPLERDRLVTRIAREFEASVIAYDANGIVVASRGGECKHRFLRISVPAGSTEPGASADGPGERITDRLAASLGHNSAFHPRPGRPADHAGPERRVGRVLVCRNRHSRARPWVFFLGLGVAGACLWLAAGVIARRLIRPLGRVVAVARDIGDGKLDSRVKLACRHGSDELGILASAINDMAVRIKKQIDDQRELLAAVSHELRTPLGHMRVLIELLRTSAAQSGRLDDLEREILEVDSLVGQLLASSRLAFDTLDRRSLDARELATRAIERVGLSGSLLQVDATDTEFDGDPTLLASALANLLDNARNHGAGVTTLRIRDIYESKGQAFIQFEVDDSGPGLAEGELDTVFDTFYRGTHRAGQSSLGLGLALVRRIAEAHGGRAFAENRPEGGARVGFSVARVIPASPVK
ncbi:MAG: HAMP domain-containing histidine kinase [Proteobacteria bacterium]|nr:HAMP domain-containing histidine kinase [Pseudomonadota bacterium]